jgi:alpha/beta superfamily hydrolase
MNAQTQRLMLVGAAGAIEALLDEPSHTHHGAFIGTAVVAHPHPLFGGTMDNKVVQTLARAFVQCGWRVVRFNFRGVGKSAGVYDEGRSELQDLLDVVSQMAPQGPLALSGFSFGSFVISHAVEALAPLRTIDQVVLVGTAASRFQVANIPADLHARTLVVHGEVDDTVPLADVMNWARPQTLPVTVIPGVEHFFHGQLAVLRSLVVRHLQSVTA